MTGRKFRLPTDAEWEYAARGGKKSHSYQYSGSNNISDVAWYDGNSGNKTHPVGTKQADELGLYDMTGNVWEWCQDWYGYYSTGSQTNPQGPSTGFFRVIRGGAWGDSAWGCRSAFRYYGVAPFGHTSGSSINGKPHVSHFADSYLKSIISEAALCAMNYCPAIIAYARRLKQKGKHPSIILNNCKNKMLHILVAMVKHKTKYGEALPLAV